jgi:molybdopterin-synthase adenylyltransferase
MATLFSDAERQRYQRQMMMNGWGEATQQKLKDSTVFVAGAGGLGSPVSIYLAVAGVGQLRICDFDAPDLSNLNRQILHDPTRLGMNKALSAKMTLERLNPDVTITALPERIDEQTVDRLVGEAECIVDCMDNFPTRYLLNDCAIRKGIPLIHGAIRGLQGQMTFIHVPRTGCLRCLVEEAPPKEVFPVVGATPGVIGTLQAMETIKYLTGIGQTLAGELLVWDGALMEFRRLRFRKDPACPSCGKAR